MGRFWMRCRDSLWRRAWREREAAREIAAHLWRQLGGALSASGRTLPGIEARTPSDQRERPGQKVASHALLAAEGERRGLPPDEAQRQAAIALGGVEQTLERHRLARGFAALEDLARDLSHAARSLRRNWTFTLAAAATLALGIGASTAIYTVVQSVLLDPLHFPKPAQLVSLQLRAPGNAMAAVTGSLDWSESLFVTASEHNRSFSAIGIWVPDSSVVGGAGPPEQARTDLISDGVLQALAVPPRLGRWLNAGDQTPNGNGAVMLSYAYWRQHFGGSSAVLGRTLLLDNRPHPIAGVMPAGFHLVRGDFDILVPLAIDRRKLILAGFGYYAVARLRPGVSIASADQDMRRLVGVWMDSWTNGPGADPHFYERWHITPAFVPLQQEVVGGLAPALWAVMGTILLVLLMACVNVMNLFLARTESRRPELVLRAALGASTGRILRSVVAESLWLALAGGGLGWLTAAGALQLLRALVPASMARLGEAGLDARSLAVCAGMAAVSGLLCGFLPALRFARGPGALAPGAAGRGATAGPAQRRRGDLLIGAQVALALVLLFSAGLLLRSFAALRSVQLGFHSPATLETFTLLIRPSMLSNPDALLATEHAIARRIAALPGVAAVSFAGDVPMQDEGHDWDEIQTEHASALPAGALPMRLFEHVAPGYFATMGIPLLAGRELSGSDLQQNRPVVVISAALARALWGSPRAALGQRLREFPSQPWFQVIGVAGDVHEDGPYHPATPTVYWPPETANGTQAIDYATFIVRSRRAGSLALLRDLTRAVHSVNAGLPLAKPRTMADLSSRALAVASFAMVMLALAGGMALLLGVIGIYGVIAYDVSLRQREIGIRLALGSSRPAVQRLFVVHALKVAALGGLAGGVAAVPLTHALRSLLFGVSPFDLATLGAVLVALALAVIAAALLPAWRGSALPPGDVLRST